jgi:protein-tyrosine phosphatase
MITFDKIIDDIFVGTCPASKIDVQRLKQSGFTAVLNLQSDDDFNKLDINWANLEQLYHDCDIAAYRIPIVDFDDDDLVSKLPTATHTLKNLVDAGHRIYVHCTAGKQRSPSTVIGYLAWHRNYGLERALELVLATRNCAPPLNVLNKVDALNNRFSI